MSIANLFTLARLLLVAPFAWLMLHPTREAAPWAGLLIAVAIATDLFDGWLARRRGTASPAGRAFDHTTDFLFVAGGLFAGAVRGVWMWALPLLVCAAFAQYMLDSRFVFRRGQLQGNRLGRANGMLYFVPLCMDILIRLGAGWLARPMSALVWLLVASTLVSMSQRLRAVITRRAG